MLLPVSIVFYRIQAYFRNSSRELKRLNAISKSPIVSLFSESLNGLFTIRAFGIQDELITKYKKFLDEHTKVFLSMSMLDRWLAVRLDMLALLIIAGVAFLGVGLRESLSPEILSLSLTYALILMGVVQFSVRMSIDVENCMTAVERLLHYSNLSKEDHSVDFAKFSNNGSIHFDNVFVKYRKELDYALKGVTFEIQPGQKIGICGRTGCGKSTTILALFRIVEVDESIGGKIYIDGVDISSVRLSELRESLCIIPQDPVLLSGTFRENLDPFNERTDEEIWETLRKIQMFSTVESFPDGLNFLVSENGGNFSHGQRQLICIGRALLRKSKIIVMDEATGSVDQNTDRLIQTMMREYFADCTVLTIAHRLETILDSDKILVLDAGQVKEFDSPETLLANPDSSFSKLYRLTDSVGDNY